MIPKLALLASSILLFIIVYLLRKRLSLKMIAMMKSPYSFEYLNMYKRLYLKSPYQGCLREDLITRIQQLTEINPTIKKMHTDETILFEREPFGQSIQSLRKKYGNPVCFTSHKIGDPGFIITVAGFTSSGYNKHITPLYYFIDDKFFLGEYMVRHLWVADKVNKLLSDLFKLPEVMDHDRFIIENTGNRTVHYYNTGFSIEVKFFSAEVPEVLEKINGYKAGMKAQQTAFATNLKPLLARY